MTIDTTTFPLHVLLVHGTARVEVVDGAIRLFIVSNRSRGSQQDPRSIHSQVVVAERESRTLLYPCISLKPWPFAKGEERSRFPHPLFQ